MIGTRTKNNAATLIAGVGLLGPAAVSVGAAEYTVELLPQYGEIKQGNTPPGLPPVLSVSGSIPSAINNAGLVVGGTVIPEGEGTGFYVGEGRQVGLNDAFSLLGSELVDVNDSGVAVGWGFDETRDFTTPGFAFTYDGTTLTEYGGFVSSAIARPTLSGINNAGVVVGSAPRPAPGQPVTPEDGRPAIWDASGQISELPLPAGATRGFAQSINNAGLIVGRADSAEDPFLRSAIWRPDGSFEYAPRVDFTDGDPGLPGSGEVLIRDLNDAGALVGHVDRALFDRRPVYVDPAGDVTLVEGWDVDNPAKVGDEVFAINGSGMMVGRSRIGNDFDLLFWSGPDASPINLSELYDTPTLEIVQAIDINDAGQITAFGFETVVFEGQEVQQAVALVLTPIPAPGAAGLLAVAGVIASRRRRG